ncbi:hypothetical protein EJ04DRAFT_578030 [Polyplosphaeria fusca]|uniref:Uncharacterized protein n=1 Tax=Polyplosphaeria fusca TaxID=682080 RepID=A0A9P4QSF4_9PLEO|nr:hypothetical protein EJ04DRAFT_578030 [Polyplosphaeria fusca]
MTVCRFSGNADMYGLGIRLGYYLQWYGGVLAAWIAPTEVNPFRFSIDLFVAATFLALIILTAQDVDSLQPVETYIVLLLMFGAYLALVPIYFWRLLTCCDPFWDPSRWPRVRPSALASNLSFIMLIGVLIYQYWFWFNRVPDLDRLGCQQYGFFFGQLRLNSTALIVINALVYVFLGLVAVYILILKFRYMVGFPDPSESRPKRQISRRRKAAHIALLQNMDSWFKLLTAIAVTVAVEVTIDWNEIENVNSLDSAGQTIPFIIGLGLVVRIFYVYWFKYGGDDDDTDSYNSYRSHYEGGPLPDREIPPLRMQIPMQQGHRPVPVRDLPRMSHRR